MYPSNSFNGNTNPISYTLDQTTLQYDTNNNFTPNSKQQQDLSSSLFYFPSSPCFNYEDDSVLLQQYLQDLFLIQQQQQQQQQQQPLTANAVTTTEPVEEIMTINSNSMESSNKNDEIPRKRSSKKDRHSKINTAQGPRDRRMRLSLEVARKFFDLQDILGFDKASKTVEWLLNKSKTAIKELSRGLYPHMKHINNIAVGGAKSSASSISDQNEDMSGIDDQSNRNHRRKLSTLVSKEKKIRALRKSAFYPRAKESREEARARARERTSSREKIKKLNESKLPFEAIMSHDMNRLGSWSPFENGEDQSGSQPKVKQLSSSSTLFNYEQNNNEISQQHQFTDVQVYGKPWEAYNHLNPC